MYILYLAILRETMGNWEPISHLQFKMELYEALIRRWGGKKPDLHFTRGNDEARFCVPRWTHLQKRCVDCHVRCDYFCPTCERKFMCLNRGNVVFIKMRHFSDFETYSHILQVQFFPSKIQF
jgi:hypothetical protein